MPDQPKYEVFVDDNAHYMDESERRSAGVFADCESAIQKCRELVIRCLQEEHTPGMTAAELLERYRSRGEDPWIAGPGDPCAFSAWGYAEQKSKEMCEGR
jgi:hypothetical protein